MAGASTLSGWEPVRAAAPHARWRGSEAQVTWEPPGEGHGPGSGARRLPASATSLLLGGAPSQQHLASDGARTRSAQRRPGAAAWGILRPFAPRAEAAATTVGGLL